MAFGEVPHYIASFSINGTTREEFLILMVDAAKKLDWDLPYTGDDGFIAYTPFRGSQNEKIHLTIDHDIATIKSESTASRFIDGGWNKKSVEAYLKSYDELKPGTESSPPDVPDPEKSKGVSSLFVPAKGFIVTPILVDLKKIK